MKKLISLLILGWIGLSMVSCVLVHASDEEIFQQFQSFLEQNNKKYTTPEEFKLRFSIFKQNYQKVELHEHLMLKSQSSDSYKLGITEFFDMTPAEFAKTHLTLDISHLQKLKAQATSVAPHYKNGDAPTNWNWNDEGKVSKVKNQGTCGSCWAFSAMGNIESVYAIKTGNMVDFSEQQLVDCDKVDQGCNGGLMEDAFKYLQGAGVMTAADYPYSGRSRTCQYDATKVQAKVTGYSYAASQDENQIKQFLYENGPLAIAINATPLQFYFWGIFNPWFEWICNPQELNHGVLLVGYGVDKNTPYWIVKNSWGSSWGEKGYFRIVAGKGACGINTYVITAQVSEN